MDNKVFWKLENKVIIFLTFSDSKTSHVKSILVIESGFGRLSVLLNGLPSLSVNVTPVKIFSVICLGDGSGLSTGCSVVLSPGLSVGCWPHHSFALLPVVGTRHSFALPPVAGLAILCSPAGCWPHHSFALLPVAEPHRSFALLPVAGLTVLLLFCRLLASPFFCSSAGCWPHRSFALLPVAEQHPYP